MKTTALALTLALVPAEPPATVSAPDLDPECIVSDMPLEDRASPLDSASVQLGEGTVKVCYGRPSARGRTMIGGDDVPFGAPWRMGANEPTILHTEVPIRVGEIELAPGSYSLYAIPGPEEWEIVVNEAVERWGIPIDDEVRAADLGSLTVPREQPEEHVETLTLRFDEPEDGAAPMIVEWEEFRATVPITAL